MNNLSHVNSQEPHFCDSGLIFLGEKSQNTINQNIDKNDVNEKNGVSCLLACYFTCYALIPLNELRVTCSKSMPPKMKKISLLYQAYQARMQEIQFFSQQSAVNSNE